MRHPFYFSIHLVGIWACLIALPAWARPVSYPENFAAADSLIPAHPDSAVVWLASWQEEMKNAPEPIRNYYRLLCVKAQDWAHIVHTSDTLIKRLIRYYEGDGDRRHLPEAYYYAGRVLCDMADEPQAMTYFEKALKTASEENDIDLTGSVYSQTGRIFSSRKLLDQAMIMTRKACRYHARARNDKALAHDLCDMATLHWRNSGLDSAEFYYNASISLMARLKDTLQTNSMKFELGNFHIALKKYDEIEHLLRPYLNHHPEFANGRVYGGMAQYFLATQQWDSARFYYEKALEHGNIHTRQNAWWGLSQIALAQGRQEESRHYLTLYDLCEDSILKITSSKVIGQAHFGYNYELHEKENRRLNEETNRELKYFSLFLAIFCVILTGIASYIIYNRRKKKKSASSKRHITLETGSLPIGPPRAEAQTPAHTPEKTVENPMILLPAPSAAPGDSQNENRAGIRPDRNGPVRHKTPKTLPLAELLLYLRSIANSGKTLTEHDWEIIENTTRKNYPDFITKLCDIHSCSAVELRVCMLVKLKVPPGDIALFVGRSKENVSSIRRRLYKKVFGEKGSSKQWDAFIHSL